MLDENSSIKKFMQEWINLNKDIIPEYGKLNLIVAMDINGLIGNGNSIPWKLPEDLKRFKELTENNIVIMGRKTHESIGRILPNRINIVLTRSDNYQSPYNNDKEQIGNLIIIKGDVTDIKQFIDCKNNNVFIIGGSEIYKQVLPIIDKIYLTVINREFTGDTYFTEVDLLEDFNIVSKEINVSEKYGLEYAYIELIRIP